ncbi:hypothetical protein JTB14_017495 [Gonioctena quinquepunctata]|nr:hypothetical protein JTB14_017495 [Gonioctena quinquepunctata]
MISEELREQEETIQVLVEHQGKQEQRSRNKNIRVYGVSEKDRENTMELFKDICVGKMNLQVNDSCFEACYRIGKREYNNGEESP